MKETLEETAEKYSDRTEEYVLKCRTSKESISHLGLYLGFIEGSKWQSERMYSEEEVIELLRKSHFVEQNIDEWFEQFKKK